LKATIYFDYYFLLEIYISLRIKSIEMRELNLQYPTCPIRNILSRMNDKWSLLILRNLNKSGTLRYKELRSAIPDISQKMLSYTLKRLEEDHLINRKMYPEIPPRVEYSLTETGKGLMPALQMMIDWALQHFDEIITK
jgi:DNA-binding HxlR family transcriptional regulator